MPTLYQRHPSARTSIEEHQAFFDQGRTLLDHTIFYNEVFPTITPEKPSNFGQSLKIPDRVNYIKGVFAQYDKNSAFDILTDAFPCVNLPITTCILHSVLSPAINNISDNIYR